MQNVVVKYSKFQFPSLYDDTSLDDIDNCIIKNDNLEQIILEDDSWEVDDVSREEEYEIHLKRISALVLSILKSKEKRVQVKCITYFHRKELLEMVDGNHRIMAAKYLYERRGLNIDVEIINLSSTEYFS